MNPGLPDPEFEVYCTGTHVYTSSKKDHSKLQPRLRFQTLSILRLSEKDIIETQLAYLSMEFAVDSLPFVVHHFEGVTSIPIHVLVPIRNSTVTEQEAHLMSGLWTKADEVPEHIRILH